MANLTDFSIPLQAQAPQNPLEQYARVLALKNMLGQEQIQEQQRQQNALNLQESQRLAQADAQARALYSQGQEPTDDQILGIYGPTKGAGIIKGLQDAKKAKIDLDEMRGKIAASEADYFGGLAASVKESGNDPKVLNYALSQAEQAGYRQHVEQIRTLLQQNPNALPQILDQAIQQSPKQQELANERTKAQASQTEANTAADKAKREADQQQFQNAVSAFGASPSKSPLEYATLVGKLRPDIATRFMNAVRVGDYNPQTSPDVIRRLAITPEQQTQADQQAANEAETKRHNQQMEGFENARNAREQQIYNQTYGPDANQALVGVPANQRNSATSAAQKAADDYQKASAAQRDMKTFIDLARSGNKEAQAYLSPEGVLTLNTGRGVTRVNRQEIDAYAGAGSFADMVKGKLGKLTKGQPIPPDVINDIEALHDRIAQNSLDSYNQKLTSINQNYHSNFKSVAGASASTSGYGMQPIALKDGTFLTPHDQAAADRFRKDHPELIK